MSTTVAKLLGIPILKTDGRLITNCGLENNVQYVTVMEAPDFHFTGLNNVLILTTLSAYHQDLSAINTAILSLCKAGVAAIAIKTGRFVDDIDCSTIKIGQKYKVPIIALNKNVLFREVLSETLSLITDNQRTIITQINKLNNQLFNAILQNRSIPDLINILCSKIPCYCCCTDSTKMKIAEASSMAAYLIDMKKVANAIDEFYVTDSIKNKEDYVHYENIIIFPCRVQKRLLGVFCIHLQDTQAELAVPLAEAIVNALCVKFLEKDLKLQTEREMVSAILDDVLFTPHVDEGTIIDRLELLNFTPLESHMIAIIVPRKHDYDKINEFDTFNAIKNVFSSRFSSSIAFKRGKEVLVLISVKNQKVTDSIPSAIGYCSSVLATSIKQWLDIGYSISVDDFRKIPDCYKQAKRAIQYGRLVDKDSRVFMYSDYYEMGLIALGLGSNDSETFFNKIINPIKEHDNRFKGDLWPTLVCCFVDKTLEQVAATLFIHISTLRYRLQKIETLTGYNYFDSKDRTTLYIAYVLYTVSKTSKTL
jgi:PucR family transcriptional regulator, purine catabolism regulatory protein